MAPGSDPRMCRLNNSSATHRDRPLADDSTAIEAPQTNFGPIMEDSGLKVL